MRVWFLPRLQADVRPAAGGLRDHSNRVSEIRWLELTWGVRKAKVRILCPGVGSTDRGSTAVGLNVRGLTVARA